MGDDAELSLVAEESEFVSLVDEEREETLYIYLFLEGSSRISSQRTIRESTWRS